jgi:hypothetical protein
LFSPDIGSGALFYAIKVYLRKNIFTEERNDRANHSLLSLLGTYGPEFAFTGGE